MGEYFLYVSYVLVVWIEILEHIKRTTVWKHSPYYLYLFLYRASGLPQKRSQNLHYIYDHKILYVYYNTSYFVFTGTKVLTALSNSQLSHQGLQLKSPKWGVWNRRWDSYMLKTTKHCWQKLKETQIHGKISCVHGLENLILLRY